MRLIAIKLLAIVALSCHAQEATVTMSLTELRKLEKEIESKTTLADNRADTIKSLQTELEQKTQLADNLQKQLTDSLALYKKAQTNVDSEIKTLTDSIVKLSTLTQKQREEIASLDMVKLRYANGRLELPYDAEKIKEAKEMFNSVTDPKLKSQYQPLVDCLDEYPAAIDQVKALISSLEFPDAERLTKFDTPRMTEWKNSALSKIENNAFYKQSKTKNFKILYLFNIIEEAKERIKNTNSPTAIPGFEDLKVRLTL